PAAPADAESAGGPTPSAEPEAPRPRRTAPRSADAPWHNPKPAFEEEGEPAPPAEPAEPAAGESATPPKPAAGEPAPEPDPTTPDNGGDA
ncbi:NADH-quinone oxidoreductase subunit C, partial [Streptomyces sp. ISL-87]|nr:NADH-quinone oxidoreductase subunit C [Streptomyces sp. ISL-21]MBT2610245.1 NADH-quinone oxidoreductase subunit C [Streptomyces sp. ISL-87]